MNRTRTLRVLLRFNWRLRKFVIMSTAELKEEIQKVLKAIPENALEEVLGLLHQVQHQYYIDDKTLDAHVDAIILENNGLLQRLAQ